MADITKLFVATVKTVKSRSKAQGIEVGKSNILSSSNAQKRSHFAKKSKEVVQSITALREFLMEHRKDYINVASLLQQDGRGLSDNERDQIDAAAEELIKKCSETIKVFKAKAKSEKVLPQVKEHREAVLVLLEVYLKDVCHVYSEAKAVRVKQVVDRKRISRLEPDHIKKKRLMANGLISIPSTSKSETSTTEETNETKELPKVKSQDILSLELENKARLEESEHISPDEAQMFEQENDQLYQEMNSMVDEVKQIEGKVVEIARLQEIFADKVLEQSDDIDRIADTVVGTTENVKDANEEIREAMKNNAGMRVWILFFLIVLSFTLLFLDWYNP